MGQLHYPPNKIPANVDPPGTRCIQITIPDDDEWEQLAYSVLYRSLALVWTNWKRTGDRTGADLNIRWRQALRTWRHCDNTPITIDNSSLEVDDMAGLFEPYCDDQGHCGFHFRCNICGTFHDVALKSDLIVSPPGTGNQPAPGGGTATYCDLLQANGKIIIPTPVSTGDLIEISAVTGKGNDGTEANWRCADGNIFYVDCTSTGSIIVGGDPAPSPAPHMSLIALFGSTAYGLYPGGSLVVPAGISNQQPVIQVNDAVITNDVGNYNVCVKITNNSAAVHCHVFNMMDGDNAWRQASVSDPITATWVGGVGWQGVPGQTTPTDSLLEIKRLFAACTITSIRVVYDVNFGPTVYAAMGVLNPGLTAYTLNNAVGHHDDTFVIGLSGCVEIELFLNEAAGHLAPAVISAVYVTVSGPDPFDLYPRC